MNQAIGCNQVGIAFIEVLNPNESPLLWRYTTDDITDTWWYVPDGRDMIERDRTRLCFTKTNYRQTGVHAATDCCAQHSERMDLGGVVGIAQGTRYDLPNSAHSRERNCLPPRPGWQQPGALPSILPGQALVFVALRLDLPRQALVVSVFCGQSPNQPTERIALWLAGRSNSRTHPDSCAAAGGPRAALGPAGVLGQPWALGTVAIGTQKRNDIASFFLPHTTVCARNVLFFPTHARFVKISSGQQQHQCSAVQ